VFLVNFVEQMYFAPKWYHYFIIFILLPLSLLYGVGMWLRRKFARAKNYGVPIVSVGNLILGGSGKTPFVIAIASRYQDVVIISRGYGRKSRGLVEVSKKGKILVDVQESGDEAMLMALSLPNATVVVSENRPIAIEKAKKHGAKLILLDDGFNRVDIEKFDILLELENIKNYFTLPSGPLREFYFTRKYANLIVKEGDDYIREVEIENPTSSMVLVTAISNPKRLDRYIPKSVIKNVYYEDHAYFNENSLQEILAESQASSILCTTKDRVKMQNFKLPISEMKLKLEIKDKIYIAIDKYIKDTKYEK